MPKYLQWRHLLGSLIWPDADVRKDSVDSTHFLPAWRYLKLRNNLCLHRARTCKHELTLYTQQCPCTQTTISNAQYPLKTSYSNLNKLGTEEQTFCKALMIISNEPLGTRSWKLVVSIQAVTTLVWQCFTQAIAPHSSIIFSATPPLQKPFRLTSLTPTRCDNTVRVYAGVRGSGSNNQ